MIEANLGVSVLCHPENKKPDCIPDILEHFRISSHKAQQCIVVGDRVCAKKIKDKK